jgi:hypothetical protein
MLIAGSLALMSLMTERNCFLSSSRVLIGLPDVSSMRPCRGSCRSDVHLSCYTGRSELVGGIASMAVDRRVAASTGGSLEVDHSPLWDRIFPCDSIDSSARTSREELGIGRL